MTKKPLDPTEARDAIKREGSQRKAAAALGVPVTTLRYMAAKAEPAEDTIDIPVLPSAEPSIDELLAFREAEFNRRRDAEEAIKLLPMQVRSDEPMGLVLFGDPHLDDSGCDIRQVRHDVETIRDTPGLYGACIGDVTNNWVGRLAGLYGAQGTTAAQAWMLAEWFVTSTSWLFMVAGNHDLWSGKGDPLKWFTRHAKTPYLAHGVRIALRFPGGREVRINARHTHKGHSQYHGTHGALRKSLFGDRDHVYVSGHIHESSYMLRPGPNCSIFHHLIQLGAYKRYDDFAQQIDAIDRNGFPSGTIVIRPDQDERRLVTFFADVAEAAEYLTWLRARRAA